jgi:uncharacterized protein YjbJ (UPF0337 family)
MSNAKVDRAKGRIKEAAGALTGDEKMKREGKTEEAIADAKEAVENVIDKAADLLKGKKKK